jgi:hypothetical protein
VADADAPEGQSKSWQPEGTGQTPDARATSGRIVGAVALFALAAVVVVIIFWLKSESLAIDVLLVAVAAILTGLASVVLPTKLRDRFLPFVVVAVGTAGLLGTVLAIPAPSLTDESSPRGTTPPPATPASEPITWNLDFNQPGDNCERFLVKNSLIKSLPAGDNLNAEWVYKNGGATSTPEAVLTVQGTSEDAVVLRKLRIIDLKVEKVPRDTAELWPCNKSWQPIPSRYYEVTFFDGEGQLSQRAGMRGHRTIDPIKPFPLQVTNSSTEVFRFELSSMEPTCLCSWKLEIEWSSGDREGKTVIDRKFGSIRTAPYTEVKAAYYRQDDGSWRGEFSK